MYANEHFNNCYFFLNFFREFFCNTQITMTPSIPDKTTVNAKTLFKLCYLNLLKNASLFYRLVSFPSRMACLLTRHSWPKIGLLPTAVNLLAKMNGHQNLLNIKPFDCHVWRVMLEHCKTFHPKPKNTDGLKKVFRLDQQGHTGLHKKTELVWKLGWTFTTCFDINCLTTLTIELTTVCPF